jgi:YD repeat-containing protein
MFNSCCKHFIFLITIMAFNSHPSFAQNTDPGALGKVSIASPNSAALGKFADIPVNKHTGVPEINVPIYTLKEGPLELPVGLSYHASGLKLDELASWVGAGWALNAGGVITRTVRGTPDECVVAEFDKNEKGHLGHNGYNNYLFDGDTQSGLPTQDVTNFNKFNSGIADGEPDLFFFNFGGYVGKFYFSDDGKAVLIPENDFKIEYTYIHPSGQSIANFTITTPDGTKYLFGKTDITTDIDPVEKTHNYWTDAGGLLVVGTNKTINSWYLNKIVSADNIFSINLTYTAEDYAFKSLEASPMSSSNYKSGNQTWKFYDHWVQGVRLDQITSSQVTITFEPGAAREDLASHLYLADNNNENVNTNSKTLGVVKIANNLGDCQKYRFSYSYFQSGTQGHPNTYANLTTDLKRLKLEQIQQESCDGTSTIPPQTFEYFPEIIPRRLSFAKDHWGFVNGKTTNTKPIPSYTEKSAVTGSITSISGADRDASWPDMRAGTLKRINLPTGGFTEFDFEPNTAFTSYTYYAKTFNYTMSVGYDGTTSANTQTRTFNSNPHSIRLTNTPAGGNAFFNGPSGLNASATPGQSTENNAFINAGTYQISLQKNNPVSGNGAEVFIYEWVPIVVDANSTVGGLRIKTISHGDGLGGTNLVSTYNYNESNGHSSGHLYANPTYVQQIRNDFVRDAGLYKCCVQQTDFYCSPNGYEICSGGEYMVSPNSIRPMETTQGNHIGYNEVKVTNGTSATNGYSIYRYYGSNVWDFNRADVCVRVISPDEAQNSLVPNFPEAPKNTDFKRGLLKFEGHFNQAGQVLKSIYYYHDFVENPRKTPCLIVRNGINLLGLPTFYELSTAKKVKFSMQESSIQQGGGYFTTTTDQFFESNFHNQVTRKNVTNSKGEVLETKYTYAEDLKPANCTSIDDGFNGHTTACATCQTQYYANRVLAGHNTGYWKYWDYQAFLKCKSVARITYFNNRLNYLNPTTFGSFTGCMIDAKNAANTDLKPIYELQKKYINTSIEITNWRASKLLNASFTKYDYTYPALNDYIYPIKSQTIQLDASSATFTPIAISGNGVVKDSRYLDEASYRIENGNIVEVVSKDGVINSYIWGLNNTVPIVKAVGVSYSVLNAAFLAVSGDIVQLRNQSTLSKAFINTYQYLPLIGMTYEIDPNGRIMRYEYDVFQRLRAIRDQDNNIIKTFQYKYQVQQ